MATRTPRPLVPGIYAPLPTFFQGDAQDLDIPALQKHALYLVKAGIRPLLAGTMGEAIHLSHPERIALIKATRETLDDAGFSDVPIVAGTGTGSTRETIELCKEAAEAGADYVIVIAPGYFSGILANNREALKDFFTEVAEESPLPVIIYNYPGASGGIDLDSDIIVEIAKDAPNTVGVKLTCGNVGKLTRICATVNAPSFAAEFPRKFPASDVPFLVLGGLTDTIVSSLAVGGHGAITGLANIAPYATAKLFTLAVAAMNDRSVLNEAIRIQGIVANADYVMAQGGIGGTKGILGNLYGYGGLCRRPLPPVAPSVLRALWENSHLQELVKLEKTLAVE